jgi:lipoprotein-anchoring transpeptidase ErfK/SrfK
MVAFRPNDSTGQIEVSISKDKAAAYVDGALTDGLGTKPKNTSAIQDGNGRTLLEIGRGEDGTKVADAEDIAAQIAKALETDTPLTLEVSLEKLAYAADPVLPETDEHWAEVNLSTQRAYFYEGSTLLRTCIISSGTAGHRTRVGSFKVWLKVRRQDMSGGNKEDDTYYYTPNVEWISYFDSEIAFHYAYWHNNFGRPMSHGCINMKKDDAIFSYEYLQKDDRVIVHY